MNYGVCDHGMNEDMGSVFCTLIRFPLIVQLGIFDSVIDLGELHQFETCPLCVLAISCCRWRAIIL